MVITNYVINNVKSSIATTFETNLTHMAVGSDDTTPTVLDTTLSSEDIREAFFDESVTAGKHVSSIFLDTTENNSNNIEEVGLFTASSGGDMYVRSLTNVIAKTSSIEVFIESNIEFNITNG